MTFVNANYQPNQKTFNHLVDEFLNGIPSLVDKAGINFPPANIVETKEAYHVELNVPGRNKEDFKINIESGLLTISYQSKVEEKNDQIKTIRKEFSFQSFKRSFTLDEKIDSAGVQAKYENGLLKLLLPKKAEVKEAVQQITIQ